MPRRKIGCIADAHYADSDSPPLYRAQAIEKTTQAINWFLAEGVDAIVVLGDTIENPESAFDAPLRCQQMADLINGDGSVPHNRPVVWVIGNHDCDHASPPARFKTDFAACTGATITTNGTDHSGDTVRGFVDVADDLRIVYLDCCFNGSDVSLPVQLSYGTVSAAQLTWLEATLSDADAVGRWSIVCVHLPLKHGGDICGNAAAIRAILAQHRVLATLHGHKHWESLDTLDSNAAGEPIYEFVIPDLRNGNVYDIQSASPCSIVEVDTDVGQVAGYGGYFFPASYAAETIPGHSWDNPTFGWLTVVPAGAIWKYDDSYTDRNTAYNAGTHPNWTDPAFDDSGWSEGPGPLGYGETWLATTVTDPGSGNRDQCLYFRKKVTLTGLDSIAAVTLRLMRDDGVVVYVNGQEYGRLGMAAGQVDQTTLANVNVFEDPPEQEWFAVVDITPADPLSPFVEGENTIAIELHNTTDASPDLDLDVILLIKRTVPATVWYVHAGDRVEYVPPASVAAGEVVVQGELVGVAALDIGAGQLGALAVAGAFEFPKQTGVGTAIAVGTSVYWGQPQQQATPDSVLGTNKYLGKTIAEAADDDTAVAVRLSQ